MIRIIVFLLAMHFLLPCVSAQTSFLPPLRGIMDKIETRRNQWTALQADMTMHFMAGTNRWVSCNGNLTYHRLDEKLLLNCFDDHKQLVFAFKTSDETFELYIPPQNTKVSGNIFDLESSPDIYTYLKPLDLYRALKPMAIFEKQSVLEGWTNDWILLKVFGKKHLTPYLSRRVYLSHQGDILKEMYYSFENEGPFLTIKRNDYQKFKLSDSRSDQKIYYPKEILIESPETLRTAKLSFDQIHFFSYLKMKDWSIPVPPQTELLRLEDPRASQQN